MISIFNKKNAVSLGIVFLTLLGCRVEPIEDPNNPSAGGVGVNASSSEIQNLVDGTESGMRDAINFYYDDVSVIGREYYRFSTSDPRFTSDLLGKSSAVLDNNTFYITNPFSARYRVVKNANILIDALTVTKAAITAEQRSGGIAWAQTVQAYQLLLVYNLLYNNGVRVDVKNPDKLGPFLSREESLNAIATLLNTAYTGLQNNAADLPFTTTLYARKASDFGKFNRAIAARVAVYKMDWATADAALAASFLNLAGGLNAGAYHLYSASGGDQLNPMFFPQNASGEARVAHPSFIADAAPGDKRLSKVARRTTAILQDALQSDYDFFLYKTNVDPISIIRNEELILMYAEVKAQTGNSAEAVNAIDRIRTEAGLAPYAGATSKDNLITEILRQRRYSLFGEGHRWIDLRRYGLLAQLPVDRSGDDVWEQFPIPANE